MKSSGAFLPLILQVNWAAAAQHWVFIFKILSLQHGSYSFLGETRPRELCCGYMEQTGCHTVIYTWNICFFLLPVNWKICTSDLLCNSRLHRETSTRHQLDTHCEMRSGSCEGQRLCCHFSPPRWNKVTRGIYLDKGCKGEPSEVTL